MNTTYVVVLAVALVLLINGSALLWTRVARQRRSLRLHDQFGPEYERAVLAAGDERSRNESSQNARNTSPP